jgi:hypothetical protein
LKIYGSGHGWDLLLAKFILSIKCAYKLHIVNYRAGEYTFEVGWLLENNNYRLDVIYRRVAVQKEEWNQLKADGKGIIAGKQRIVIFRIKKWGGGSLRGGGGKVSGGGGWSSGIKKI